MKKKVKRESLRQDCCISSTHFNIYSEELLNVPLEKMDGMLIERETITQF